MDDILKGNFKVKKQVKEKKEAKKDVDKAKKLQEELKKEAINSIGGSMVYVERTDLTWDGDDES